MATPKKISALGAAGTLDGTEEVAIVQSGATVKGTTQDIADLAAAPAGNLTVTRDLTNAEVLALSTTPIELIAAPGAGKHLLVIVVYQALTGSPTTPSSSGASPKIAYSGGEDLCDDLALTNLAKDVNAGPDTELLMGSNQSIEIRMDFGTGAGYDGTMRAFVEYRIESLV